MPRGNKSGMNGPAETEEPAEPSAWQLGEGTDGRFVCGGGVQRKLRLPRMGVEISKRRRDGNAFVSTRSRPHGYPPHATVPRSIHVLSSQEALDYVQPLDRQVKAPPKRELSGKRIVPDLVPRLHPGGRRTSPPHQMWDARPAACEAHVLFTSPCRSPSPSRSLQSCS
jgi:hypothetical protein